MDGKNRARGRVSTVPQTHDEKGCGTMRIKKVFAATLFASFSALFLASCAASPTPEEQAPTPVPSAGVYQKLTAEEASSQMDALESFVLLDVRTEEEYKELRIDGATLLPLDEIDARAEEALPDKEAHIFVYCRSGRRSAEAAKKLLELGYTNVYDFGGIIDWPYDTVSG